MRKQTKLVAVLSAAALLAIGASMTSFADVAHWDQQDGEWVYLDRNGDRVESEWKKSNNQWYYLDEDGFMAREKVIEDGNSKYYVDANGVRVTNAWVSFDNDDLLDDDDAGESIDTVWMYFDGTGKAIGVGSDEGVIKKLSYGDGQSGYFIFDQEGYMLSGWQRWSKSGDNKRLYYLGTQNEGWAYTGWNYLEVDTDLDVFSEIPSEDPDYADESYFYFDSNGKAYENSPKTINGKTYAFDRFGRMLDLWVYNKGTIATKSYTNSDGSSTASDATYYQEDNGGRDKEWIYAYRKTGYDSYSDDPYWFYLNKNGTPFIAGDDISAGAAKRIDDTDKSDVKYEDEANYSGEVSAKSIKNQTYLFNNKGVMLTGLFELDGDVGKGSDTMKPGIYYFTIDGDHGSTEGQMVKNKKVIIDVDGDDETYYFKSTGEAYTSVVVSDCVYKKDGKLAKYGDGNTYERVSISEIVNPNEDEKYVLKNKDGKILVETDNGNTKLFINEKGKIKKTGSKVTDVNGEKVDVKDYIATLSPTS